MRGKSSAAFPCSSTTPGIAQLGSVEDLSLEEWRRGMSVNVDSVFLGCKYALPLMRESQPGSIINISSIAGLIASHNFAVYNASKAAVWLLSKSVALHCARNGWDIRCNSVHPTFIKTPILDSLIGDRDEATVLAKLARAGAARASRRGRRRRERDRLSRLRREPIHDRRGVEARRRHFGDVT